MQQPLKLPISIQNLLSCPRCKAKLQCQNEELICNNSQCNSHFPIINGIPVLINDDNSVFSIDDFLSYRDTYFPSQTGGNNNNIWRPEFLNISKNIKGKQNFEKFVELLINHSSMPKVLIIGGSVIGQGMDPLINSKKIELIESDVSFGPRTMMIADAHDIPFDDGSFDGVVAQAVLEHVVDPYRCVDEIYRVLNKHGLVYAETPFMQQVHGGRYDFTRFTHLGHRRLFRRFDEIDSGAVCGPGMALAWSYKYFLQSFTASKKMRRLIGKFAALTSFYLKYLDYYLIDKPQTLDAASGYYFIGEKNESILSDRELITMYKGAV